MEYIWMGFIGGMAAFAHCLGMCGVFALHLGGVTGRRGAVGRLMLWSLGRITTYTFLGALAGVAGGWIGSRGFTGAQKVLTYAAGAVMLFIGLSMLGLIPKWKSKRRTQSAERRSDDNENAARPAAAGQIAEVTAKEGTRNDGESLTASMLGRFFAEPGAGGALGLGIVTGFLPCPIVIGMLALAAKSGTPLLGMGVMAAMGVGTMWSLTALGLTGHLAGARLRKWGVTVGGVVLILLGATTAMRGTAVFHKMLGCETHSAASEGATEPESCPFCSGEAPMQ